VSNDEHLLGTGAAGKGFPNLFSVPSNADRQAGNVLLARAREFKENVGRGVVAINELGLRKYTMACDFFLDRYAEHADALRALTVPAEMGSSPYAYQLAAQKAAEAADMLAYLALMREAVEVAKEALQLARGSYVEP
jgi:hypothetical protein